MRRLKPDFDPDQLSKDAAEATRKAQRSRTLSLPKGFKKHDGGPCPVEPDSYVELLIRTGEGIGGTRVQRAKEHEWEDDKHEGGLGAIVAYRPADGPQEISVFRRHDRFKIKGIK